MIERRMSTAIRRERKAVQKVFFFSREKRAPRERLRSPRDFVRLAHKRNPPFKKNTDHERHQRHVEGGVQRDVRYCHARQWFVRDGIRRASVGDWEKSHLSGYC